MQFSRHFWRRRNQHYRRALANIKSKEEIDALSNKIKTIEAQEFAKFEHEFDEELKDL
jgi:hypothetical protein